MKKGDSKIKGGGVGKEVLLILGYSGVFGPAVGRGSNLKGIHLKRRS
jgi:hypothetical protein